MHCRSGTGKVFILAACREIKTKSSDVGVLQLPEMQQGGDMDIFGGGVPTFPFSTVHALTESTSKGGHLVYYVSLGLVLKNQLGVPVNKATARL